MIENQEKSLSGMEKEAGFMSLALSEAVQAAKEDEIPIGCVIVRQGQVIARAHNTKEQTQQPTAHAEIRAIEEACRKLGTWHLEDCDLYVTAEPCLMCAGAIIQARLSTVYFGCSNPKGGALHSSLHAFELPGINHRPQVVSGLHQVSASRLLSQYFKAKRKKKSEGREES